MPTLNEAKGRVMDLSKATCATCPMYSEHKDCRNRSPRMAGTADHPNELYPGGNVHFQTGIFPVVFPEDWCGEHPIRRAAYELAVQAEKEARG